LGNEGERRKRDEARSRENTADDSSVFALGESFLSSHGHRSLGERFGFALRLTEEMKAEVTKKED